MILDGNFGPSAKYGAAFGTERNWAILIESFPHFRVFFFQKVELQPSHAEKTSISCSYRSNVVLSGKKKSLSIRQVVL
jgi:hypothetical protein